MLASERMSRVPGRGIRLLPGSQVYFTAVAGTQFREQWPPSQIANAAANPTSFTATINWGDCTTTLGNISGNAQPFTVAGTQHLRDVRTRDGNRHHL